MMAALFSQDVTAAELLSRIREHPWPEDALLMAFTPFRFSFAEYAFDENLFSEADQARIFSPKGELRWRRIGEKLRAVYMGEDSFAGLQDFSAYLGELEREQEELILWGRRLDTQNTWIEQQVPQHFQYPLPKKGISLGRAALVVEHWMDAAGLPRFSRYHSIKEIKGES